MTIYLYEKQHSITGLKYFGCTCKDPYTYTGSGSKWLKHLKNHGKDHVITINVWEFADYKECSLFALKFSLDNDIVESEDWANLVIEYGGKYVPKGWIDRKNKAPAAKVIIKPLEAIAVIIPETQTDKHDRKYPGPLKDYDFRRECWDT